MRLFFVICFAFLLGCSDSEQPSGVNDNSPSEVSYRLTEAFPNLSFSQPLDLQHAGDESGRLFVVEKPGIIKVLENSSSVSNSSIFLDIRDRVDDSGNEEGLLGLAFHPNY